MHIYLFVGRLHNETGHMVQWWTNASIANYVERQQCYVDQYSQYSQFGVHVSYVYYNIILPTAYFLGMFVGLAMHD